MLFGQQVVLSSWLLELRRPWKHPLVALLLLSTYWSATELSFLPQQLSPSLSPLQVQQTLRQQQEYQLLAL